MTSKLTLLNSEANSFYNEFKNSDKNQAVLQIPSSENECEIPSLLISAESDNSNSVESKLFVTDLDSIFDQVKSNYANDTDALKRFSYYLVLKAKELSE